MRHHLNTCYKRNTELHTRPGRYQAFDCAQSAVGVAQRMLVQADGLQQLLGDLPEQLLAEACQVLPENVLKRDCMYNEPLDAGRNTVPWPALHFTSIRNNCFYLRVPCSSVCVINN